MNPSTLRPRSGPDYNAVSTNHAQAGDVLERLADSRSRLYCADDDASVSELLAWGQHYWHVIPKSLCCGLSQLSTLQHVALLLTALVQQRSLVLAASTAQLPSWCYPLEPARPAPLYQSYHTPPTASDHIAPLPGHFAVQSSGTLGNPKLIWHTAGSTLACAQQVGQRLGLARGERVLISVPLHHMYGLGAALLPALLAEAEVYLLPQANVLSLLQALKIAPHWVYTTPHQLRTVAGRLRRPQSQCRGLVLAGDGVADTLVHQAATSFPQIFNLYGSSELGVIAISAANHMRRLLPLPGVEFCGPAPGAGPAPLSVRHPFPAARIDRRDRAQPVAQSLIQPWPTADLASCNLAGHWQLHGRADFSLNRAGKLLILAELEQQIMSWPGVAQALAVAVDADTAIGKAIAVWVQPSQPGELNEASLRALAQQQLPAFARPEYFRCVAQLPCLPSGKPDRSAIARESHHGSNAYHRPTEKHSE